MIYKQILIPAVIILFSLFPAGAASPKTFSDKKPVEIKIDPIKTITPLLQMKIIIDNVNNGIVRAYITREDFKEIQLKGYPVRWVPVPTETVSASKSADLSYPEYGELSTELSDIALSVPEICSLVYGGVSAEGRTLWWIKLSDNVNAEEFEPEVHFIGGIHGDEPVGVVLSLELVRYLTANYATDTRVKSIIDTTELWIMPLMNPDGYTEGERWNAGGKDLNRSFPVFDQTGPGGMLSVADAEPEVAAIIEWSLTHRSVLSANLHSGALVVNYPFDYTGELCQDNDLFEYISLQYSSQNTPMYNTTNPITAVNGTIRGALWYQIEGGMQDWAYLATGSNQVTIELSGDKRPDTNTLQTLWEDNRESMLAYIETVHCGIKGLVTDVQSGAPLMASVKVDGNSHSVYTDPDLGDYHKMLLPGDYSLQFQSDGYSPQTKVITIENNTVSQLNIQLVPDGSTDNDFGCFIIAAEK